MQIRGLIGASFALFFCFSFLAASSQGAVCPPNLDFENGDFTNWECRTGSVSAAGGNNIVTWSGFTETFDRHTIIPNTDLSLDLYGGFPTSCPNGSGFSIKLGNDATGAEAEGVFYTYSIPATVTDFSILYYYAIVFQDPGHSPPEQPRFVARIVDVATNTDINCVSFDFTSSASLPGFHISSRGGVVYKEWTPITVDLSSYAGHTIRLEFITSDCTRGGHFGYAYVDVSSSCNGTITGRTLCEGDSTLLLNAPFGFQNYQWFANTNFTSVINFTQSLFLAPAPPIGSIFPVIVTPYPGFGCEDTLYATIATSPKPPSVAGPDKIVCSKLQVRLGGPVTSNYSYTWTPSLLLIGSATSNPFTVTNLAGPTNYILKTTDLATGCSSFDTVKVTPVHVDTSMNVAGRLGYCAGETLNSTFTVNNSFSTTQWYKNNILIPGATALTYTPFSSGNYWAKINNNGCIDTSRILPFTVSPVPQAAFTLARDTQCMNNPIPLINTSVISGGEPLNYFWSFNDGTTDSNMNSIKTFTTLGNAYIKLVVISSYGCADSIQRNITLLPNGTPDFAWDSVCTGRATRFMNLTNENGTPLALYHWDFKNGFVSNDKTPGTFIYDNPGIYDVSLKVVNLGCENAPQIVVKPVLVSFTTPNKRYNDIYVVEGSITQLTARDSIGTHFNWQPPADLSDNLVRNPLYTAVSRITYLIRISDDQSCFTTDTLLVNVMKQPGIYMPTAFTPNGDGLNDDIKPLLVGMQSLKRFSIFNRYGNIVFSTTKEGVGWDGTYQGSRMESAVFVWMIEYVGFDGKTRLEKGTITLIR